MAGRPLKLGSLELPTTPTVIYTVPTGKYTIVTMITAAVQIKKKTSVWIGSEIDDDMVWHDVEPAEAISQMESASWVMEVGDEIIAECEAVDSVTLRFDGIEIDL